MHLLTWHGTVVCSPGADGILRHHALPLAQGCTPLDFNVPDLTQPAQLAHPVLGWLTFTPAKSVPCVHIRRAGFLMCAAMPGGMVLFDRTDPDGWETFLPLTASTLADLNAILRSGWVDATTRAFVRRSQCAIEGWFWLRIGLFAADLTDGLDSLIAGRREDGVPSRLRLGRDNAAQEVIAAPPGTSALVVTSRRPSRGRRMAEILTLAAYRHLGRREPDQDEFADACARLEAHWGADGVEALFESITPPAASQYDEPARAPPPEAHEPESGSAQRLEQAKALYEAGRTAQLQGSYTLAERLWSECLEQRPNHAIAALELAALLRGLGRPFDAIARLQALLAQVPAQTDVRLQLAHCYAELGWIDRAQTECAKARGELFGWAEETRQTMEARLAAERAAAASLTDARSARVLSADEQRRLARSLFASGDIGACEAVLEEWQASGELPGEAWLLWAELALRASGTQAALVRIHEAPAAAQRHAPLVLLHAKLRLAAGEASEAAEALKFLVTARPNHDAYVALCRALLALADHAALGKATRDWMAYSPRDVDAAMFCIEAARAAGRVSGYNDARAGALTDTPTIVQFWNDSQPPDDVAATAASWPGLNPYARHVMFDDAGARAFIAQNCGGKVLQAYEAAYHPAMRSDIFRLAYLEKHGGCYADADELCVQSIEKLFGMLAHADFVGIQSGHTPPYVHNSAFLVRRNSALMREALAEACATVVHQAGKGQKPDIWQVTGPGLVTRAIARALGDADAGFRVVLLSPEDIFGFMRTQDLAYKLTRAGNWRVA